MGWLDELKSAEGLQAALVQHGPQLATGLLAVLLAIQAGFIVTSQNRGAAPKVAGGALAPSPAAEAPALRVNEITSATCSARPRETSTTRTRRRRACSWCWRACWRCRIPSGAWPYSARFRRGQALHRRQRRPGRRQSLRRLQGPRPAGSRRCHRIPVPAAAPAAGGHGGGGRTGPWQPGAAAGRAGPGEWRPARRPGTGAGGVRRQ